MLSALRSMLNQGLSAADEQRMIEEAGFATKPHHRSDMLLREDAPNTFRVQCFDCLTQFDVFGTLEPATADCESEVVQRLLEHLHSCDVGRTDLLDTLVIKNRHSPIYKFSATWKP